MPANDFIKIDRTQAAATQSGTLYNAVQQLRVAFELTTRVLAVMNHTTDGTTFTTLETLFGLPTGTGQTVYNMVNGSVGTMQGQFGSTSDSKNLTERVG